MSAELKVLAYGVSVMGDSKVDVNADNLYMNGRYFTGMRDETAVMTKTTLEDQQVYAVADGFGITGDKAIGNRYSELVMTAMCNLHENILASGEIERDTVWDALYDVSERMVSRNHQQKLSTGGASFASIFFKENLGLVAHAGDCAVFVLRDGKARKITDDQLTISELYNRGVISAAKLDLNKASSKPSIYLGMEELQEYKAKLFSKRFVFMPGDRFLLCTDGVTDCFRQQELEDLLRELQGLGVKELAQTLASACKEKSKDDFTLLLLEMSGDGENAPRVPAQPTQGVRVESYQTPAEGDETPTQPLPTQKEIEEAVGTEPKKGIFSQLKDRFTSDNSNEDDWDEDEDEDDYDSDSGSEDTVEPEETDEPYTKSRKNLLDDGFELQIEDDDDDFEDDDEYSDGEGFIARLKQNPAMLAIGIVTIILVLLTAGLVIKSALGNGGKESSVPVIESSQPESESESEPEESEESEISEEESEEISEPESVEESESEPEEEDYVYTVVSGDTLSNIISKYYGKSDADLINAICEYNNIKDKNTIRSGQKILLPSLKKLGLE